MILYTPLAAEDIFPAETKEFDSHQIMQYRGRTVQAEHLGNGTYRVHQLLSTDPADFLDESCAPGKLFSL
ncbi:YlzJ-like family protein [Terribacillus sp. 7520-G]|uniref:YlzJ-like family protein n=1 Tax=Terribacillus TaxID=459532 RepID=UPI000BA55DF3|nr:YlzJ-like family protein [Terribacillus sp. 7520-G]PAD40115.1 hypothetical protein CHH53_03620 [Terribacillus sp. 7520-G]